MTLEVEMPHPTMAGMKQKGRVYVCDLAGTEPAGDIVFARYEKKVFPNGDIEHKYLGPHDDDRKTKELQVQRRRDVDKMCFGRSGPPAQCATIPCCMFLMTATFFGRSLGSKSSSPLLRALRLHCGFAARPAARVSRKIPWFLVH